MGTLANAPVTEGAAHILAGKLKKSSRQPCTSTRAACSAEASCTPHSTAVALEFRVKHTCVTCSNVQLAGAAGDDAYQPAAPGETLPALGACSCTASPCFLFNCLGRTAAAFMVMHGHACFRRGIKRAEK